MNHLCNLNYIKLFVKKKKNQLYIVYQIIEKRDFFIFYFFIFGVVKVPKQANKRKEKVNRNTNTKLKDFFFGR